MRRLAAAVPVLAVALTLTACASGPSRETVVNRFAIELASGSGAGNSSDWTKMGELLADDAFKGRCGSDAYRSQLTEKSLVRAWDATCSMYFENDMTPSQLDRAKRSALEGAVGG